MRPRVLQVMHGELTEAPLETLSALAQNVFLPLLTARVNQEGWPDVVAQEVSDSMHRLVATGAVPTWLVCADLAASHTRNCLSPVATAVPAGVVPPMQSTSASGRPRAKRSCRCQQQTRSSQTRPPRTRPASTSWRRASWCGPSRSRQCSNQTLTQC
jgi:hypothetical protein